MPGLATSVCQAVSRRLGWTASSDLLRLPDELLYHICVDVAEADKQARMRGDWTLRALLDDPSEHIFEGVDKAAATRQDWARLCALVDLLRAKPHLGQYIQHLDALAEIAYAKFAELNFTWPAEVDGVLVRLLAMSPNLKSIDVFPVKKKDVASMKWLDYTLRHIVFPFLSYRKIPSRVRISIENFQWHGRILAHHRHAAVVGNTSLSITEGGLDDADSWRHLPLSCPKLQHLTLAPPALPLCLSKGLAPSTLQSLTIRTSAMLMEHAVKDRDLLEKFWIDRYQPFLAALHQLPALERIQLDLAPFNADVLRALGHVAPALRELVFDGPAWRSTAVRDPETDADILDAISSLNMLRRVELLTVPDDDEPDVLPATKAYCKTRGIELLIVPEALEDEEDESEGEDFEDDEKRSGDVMGEAAGAQACAVFEFSPSSSSSAHGPHRAITASQDPPTAACPPYILYEPASPKASRPLTPRAMSSPILRLPEELLDLISGFVVELEGDGVVTTLALFSTCRRLLPSARRALWSDPTRSQRLRNWHQALHFQNTLLKKPGLGRLIVRLDWLVDVQSAFYRQKVEELLIENWTRHLLSTCPGLRSLAVFPCVDSKWPAELASLPSLRHLTVAARSVVPWVGEDWINHLDFLGTLDVSRLVSLTLRDLYLEEPDPSPEIVLPPLALCLEEIDLLPEATWRLLPLSLRNVRRLTVRPRNSTGLDFVTSLIPPELESLVIEPLFSIDTMSDSVADHDEEDMDHLSFPFTELRELRYLRHLVLRSILIDFDDFQLLTKAAPNLEYLDLKNSRWDDYWWDRPPNKANMILSNSLDGLPCLRFLDLGFLPVANYRSPMRPLTEYCAERGIECQWRPLAGPLPGHEEAGDPGEIIDPGPLDKQDEVGADLRHPRAILQREPQLGDVDPSDALVEDPFGWAPSSRETTPFDEVLSKSFLENVSNLSDADSSSTPSPPSSPDYLPAPLDDPRLASDYEARDTVDEPDEEPWWDWRRPCDFEAADKAWMELEKDVEAGTFPFP
ncbi:hypothetical protein OF846_001672 [Rhodotorula toruloides]|nr:hypothetical protein OF846_001672 [Rhodotorula toruloides]